VPQTLRKKKYMLLSLLHFREFYYHVEILN
jgi:hypothetical protein